MVIIPSSKAYEPIKDADLEAGGDKLEDEQLGEEGDEASFVPKMELN